MPKVEKPSNADLRAERAIKERTENKASRDEYAKMLEESYGKILAASLMQGRQAERIEIDKLVPAPGEWNDFPPLSPDERLEMKFSIMANGLFSPIIVWDREDGTYMILSGHNRTSVYREILEEYQEMDMEELLAQAPDDQTRELIRSFDIEKFRTVEAFVRTNKDTDETKAQEIIIDSNYVQRGKDKKLETTIIKKRINITKNRRDLKGKTMNIVAKEMNISASTVLRQWMLGNKITPAMREFYYDGRLSLVAVLRFHNLSEDTQNWIAEEYGDKLTSKMLQKVSDKKNYSKADLANLFDKLLAGEEMKKVSVTVQVREEWADEIRKKIMEYIYNKEKNERNNKTNAPQN